MGRLDNYEEVKDRLPRFWNCVKDGRIITEIIDHSENWDRVVVKASLYDAETLIATGTAMDWKGKDNQANRTNWVEVAETSAIGRAIANSRYQDPKAARPSREEMEVALERQSDPAPADDPVVKKAQQPKSHPIKKLCDEHNLTDALLNQFCAAPGRAWIKPGQSWSDVPKDKLDKVYERASKNPTGFIATIKGA